MHFRSCNYIIKVKLLMIIAPSRTEGRWWSKKKSYSNIDIGKCESLMLPLDAIRRATSRNSTMLVLTNFELHNKVHIFWEGVKDGTMFVEFYQKISKRTDKIPKWSDTKSKKDGQELKSSKNKFHVPRTVAFSEKLNFTIWLQNNESIKWYCK